VPPSGFCVDARRTVSPRSIHVLSPDLVTMDNLMIIPLRVAQRTVDETRGAPTAMNSKSSTKPSPVPIMPACISVIPTPCCPNDPN